MLNNKNVIYWRKIIKIIFNNIQKYAKNFFLDRQSVLPFVIIIIMTVLLFYNNSMIVNAQKTAYESNKIADELRDSSEDLTKYVRTFVVTGEPKYERKFWQVLNIRNGKEARPDGRKVPLRILMKQLGFTQNELEKLKKSQTDSDKLVKKEVIAMNAIKGIPDDNISKLIKPNESMRDFAIRITNDEAYYKDKATIMKPISDVIQLVDKRTQIKLMHYNILNYIYMFITFLIVFLLFLKFTFLINKLKQHIQSEKVVRKIIEIMRGSIGINSVRNEVVREIGTFFKADRVFFADYDSESHNFSVAEDSEYKSSEKIKSYAGNEVAITEGLVGAMERFPLQGKDLIFSDLDKYLEENNLNEVSIEKTFREMGCISMIGMHISYGEFFYGDIVVTFENKRKINEEDINFVKTLANQAGIAIYQSKLYEKEKEMVEKESLMRKIFETMRSSLELDAIKNTIVNEVGKALNADRCFLRRYDKDKDVFIVDQFSEYRSSHDVKSLMGINSKDQKIEWLTDLYKINKEVIFSNIKQFVKENSLEKTPLEEYFKKYNVKASYSIPIYNSDEMLGVLIVQYTKDYVTLSSDDINFLRIVAVQAGEAIYQAKLYRKVQLQAERERISRTIIEILRSSMDKEIIKKLFVKNIGNFFDADRVFFSDYDSAKNTYLPVDKDSEYLSINTKKSFIGFDWSNPNISGHIQPLLEKREIKIINFDEYIKENPKMSKELISRYVDFDVKSSYNFPVLHQNDIMGYFCIEFTSRICELSDEDINRIRSICTQAGIALYHAELYLQAQQCALSKESSISEISNQIKKPVNEILDLSMRLSKTEFERKAQLEYVNTIISSCNQLLALTKSISQD